MELFNKNIFKEEINMNFRELRCLKITDRRLVTELKDFDIRGLPSPEFLFIDMESLIKIPEDFKIDKYISSIEGIFSDYVFTDVLYVGKMRSGVSYRGNAIIHRCQ